MSEDEEYFEDSELDLDDDELGAGDDIWADDDAPEFITLEYDDNSSERCEVLGVFPYDNNQYIALSPQSDPEAVYIYGYKEHRDGTFSLIEIEDDAEFEAASAEFEDLLG